MPETIRTSGDRHPRQCGFCPALLPAGRVLAACSLIALTILSPTFAHAGGMTLLAPDQLDRHEIAILLPMVGLILFAVITAIMLVGTRRRTVRLEGASRDEIIGLQDRLDRANALLLSERQVLVDWLAASNRPSIDGDLDLLGVTEPHRVLAFGSWLDAAQASEMERAVGALRAHGEAFAMTLITLGRHPIEAHGRAIGGRAVLSSSSRFRATASAESRASTARA